MAPTSQHLRQLRHHRTAVSPPPSNQPAVSSTVFYDRTYTFESLRSFTGHSFIKMSNEDKHIRHSHVQMKLTVCVAQLDITELPRLQEESLGRCHPQLRLSDQAHRLVGRDGPGAWRCAATTELRGNNGTDAVELRGDNGADGSRVIFVANAANPPTPSSGELLGAADYIGCFVDDSARNLGAMVGSHTNAATNLTDHLTGGCQSGEACDEAAAICGEWGEVVH